MGIMTDEQLKTLNDDIESGLVMTLTVKHYEQLQAENKEVVMILGRYGRHDASCETELKNPCFCGFDAVIERFSKQWEQDN